MTSGELRLKKMKLFCVFSLVWTVSGVRYVSGLLPRIAVVGGGIGGASSCYFLRELFGKDVAIDLYESKGVGGRLAVIEIGGYHYEAGGSVIHQRNKYMSAIAEKAGLKHSAYPEALLGIYNGKEYVFKQSKSSIQTYIDLFWRYGLNLFRWDNLIEDMLSKFDNIYKYQDKEFAFTTVEKLLASMDSSFVNLTQTTAQAAFEEVGFTELFIREFGLGVTRVNYGQTTGVNGLVGAIALAAAQPKLWSIYGGNYQLAESAINLSKAKFINKKVSNVMIGNGSYILTSVNFDANKNELLEDAEYDIVVIACPQTKDLTSIKFQGFPADFPDFPGNYHQTVATFVEGEVNISSLGFSNADDIVEDIITINTDMIYNSISRNYPINYNSDMENLPKVWKLFSQDYLSDETLDLLFVKRNITKEIAWLAYPHYTPPENLGSFHLHKNLYYVSPIEWAGSAMEMSGIAGRNAALLAYNQWKNNTSKIDPEAFTEETLLNIKDEL